MIKRAVQLLALAGAASAANSAPAATPLGPPGSAQRERAIAEIRAAITAGTIDPRCVLLEASAMGLRPFTEPDAVAPTIPNNRAANCPGDPGASEGEAPDPDPDSGAHGIHSSSFAYFDGFETYTPYTDLGVSPVPVGLRLNAQVQTSGFTILASSFLVAAPLPQAALPPGGPGNSGGTQPWVYAPAVPLSRNPYNPGGAGGYPADRDPDVEQAVCIAAGSRLANNPASTRLVSGFLGMNLRAHHLYEPDATHPLVICADFYAPDAESAITWSPTSFTDQVVTTRILAFGYGFQNSPFEEPDRHLRRPRVLGYLNGESIGQLYAPPLNPAPALPTLRCKTGEWFTIAVRFTSNTLEVFMRDSGTDGSASILIDDARDIPLFESGWTSILPGEDATFVSESAGVATWRGYGRAVNEAGSVSPSPAPLGAVGLNRCDGFQTTLGHDPSLQNIPVYQPTNYWMDNFAIIGNPILTFFCPGETNGDDVVNSADLATLLGAWGTAATPVDLNADGVVNANDLALLLGAWGPCPP